MRSLNCLTSYQLEVVTGSLLGDASLHHYHDLNCNWSFTKRQSILDKDGVDKKNYLTWHQHVLEQYSSRLTYGIANVKYDYYEFCTISHPVFTELAKKWYKMESGKWIKNNSNRIIKTVPNDIKLTPLSLCVWMMDDGFCYAKDANALICTHGFTKEEVSFLIERLDKDLGIYGKLREVKQVHKKIETKKPVIYIGRKSYFQLIETIKPHVSWDCFKYKIDTSTYNKTPNKGENHCHSKLTEEEVKKIFKMRQEGMLCKDIAEKMNVTNSNVSLILRGDRWSYLGMKIKTRRNPRVDNDQIRSEILKMSDEGKSQLQIATHLNTSQATVSRILKRCHAAD